MYSRSN